MSVATDKSPGLAALLSFIFSGLGEIYAGKPLRGIPLMVTDIYLVYLFYTGSSFSPGTLHLNTTPLFISFFVTAGSMVNAYLCAKQYNAQNFSACPRCGGKNPLGAPQCLLCWTPLGAAAAPAYGPQPGPPPLAPPAQPQSNRPQKPPQTRQP